MVSTPPPTSCRWAAAIAAISAEISACVAEAESEDAVTRDAESVTRTR